MAVRHHGDIDSSLGLLRGENRDTPFAHVVVAGPVVERCVDGASATLTGHRSTAVQELVPTTTLVTWWPLACLFQRN